MKIHVSLAVMVLLVAGLLLVDAQKSARSFRKHKSQPSTDAGEEISGDPKEETKQKSKKSDAESEKEVQPGPSGQEKNGQQIKKSRRQPAGTPAAGGHNNNTGKGKQDRPAVRTSPKGKPSQGAPKDDEPTEIGPQIQEDQPSREDGEDISDDPKEETKQKPKKSSAGFKGRVQPDPSGQAQVKNGQKENKSSRQPEENPEQKAGRRPVRKNNNGKGKHDTPEEGSSRNNEKPIKTSKKQPRGKPNQGARMADESVEQRVDEPYNSTDNGVQEIDGQNDNIVQGDQVTDDRNKNPDQGDEVADDQYKNPDQGYEVTDDQNKNPQQRDEVTDGQNDSPDQGDSDVVIEE